MAITRSRHIKSLSNISIVLLLLATSYYFLHLITKCRCWEYSQSTAFFNTTSLPSLHHIIFTNPIPRLQHQITIAMSSRHVKSFSNMRLDLLDSIVVTSETSIVTAQSSPPTPNPRPTEPSNHTVATEFTSRQVILHYTYQLTCSHIGNFRDVPLIEVTVES